MFSQLFSDWSKLNLLSNSFYTLKWASARARLQIDIKQIREMIYNRNV